MRYVVVDNEFNREWYSDMIGMSFDNPPAYAAVKKMYTVFSPDARKLGAIGIFYPISVEIEAKDEEMARKIFYDTHDLLYGRIRVS